jgi:hypothetical protein
VLYQIQQPEKSRYISTTIQTKLVISQKYHISLDS